MRPLKVLYGGADAFVVMCDMLKSLGHFLIPTNKTSSLLFFLKILRASVYMSYKVYIIE